jgi:hypothetical protein
MVSTLGLVSCIALATLAHRYGRQRDAAGRKSTRSSDVQGTSLGGDGEWYDELGCRAA